MLNKKLIVGIVVFIFAGLLVFSFANPGEKKQEPKPDTIDKVDDEPNNDQDDKKQDDEKQADVIGLPDINNVGIAPVPIGNNEDQEQIDTYLEEAIKAVQIAESSRKIEDINNAQKLVDKIINKKSKSELQNRLNIINDILNKLQELELLIKTAESKLDLVDETYNRNTVNTLETILKTTKEFYNNSITANLQQITNAINTLQNAIDNLALKVAVNIEVTNMPNKLVYEQLENLDLTGLLVNLVYDDGTKSELVYMTDYTVSGFENITIGEKQLLVTYNGEPIMTTTINYEIINETVLPVITLNDNKNIDIQRDLFVSTYLELGATATDNLDGAITNISITYAYQAPYTEEKVNVYNVDTRKIGIYIVTYSTCDSNNNCATETRIVRVYETNAPVLTLNHANTIIPLLDLKNTYEVYSEYVEHGATAIDYIDGQLLNYTDLTSSIKINTDELNMNQIGTYNVYYSVKDWSGNETVKTRVVRVVDNTKPVINLTTTYEAVNVSGVTINVPIATVTDNYDTNIVATKNYNYKTEIVLEGLKLYSVKYIESVTYKAKDSSGNDADNKTYTLPQRIQVEKTRII